MIGASVTILIILLFFSLIGFFYFLLYKNQAQKALESDKSRKFKLPTPRVFILIILLSASLLGNAISIFSNKDYTPFYRSTSFGEIKTEYKYIEDEVINGYRGEYIVNSKVSNDFIIYYATIKEGVTDPLLAKYIVYIKYKGNESLEYNYHLKYILDSKKNKITNSITTFKDTSVILMIQSHEITDLEISGEIKNFELSKDKLVGLEELNSKFEEAELLYSFKFLIKDSVLQ